MLSRPTIQKTLSYLFLTEGILALIILCLVSKWGIATFTGNATSSNSSHLKKALESELMASLGFLLMVLSPNDAGGWAPLIAIFSAGKAIMWAIIAKEAYSSMTKNGSGSEKLVDVAFTDKSGYATLACCFIILSSADTVLGVLLFLTSDVKVAIKGIIAYAQIPIFVLLFVIAVRAKAWNPEYYSIYSPQGILKYILENIYAVYIYGAGIIMVAISLREVCSAPNRASMVIEAKKFSLVVVLPLSLAVIGRHTKDWTLNPSSSAYYLKYAFKAVASYAFETYLALGVVAGIAMELMEKNRRHSHESNWGKQAKTWPGELE